MEADENSPESLPPWVRLEYAHMLQRTFWSDSPQNKVYFSNLSEKSAKALTSQLGSAGSTSQSPFIATTASVEQLIDNGTLPQKHRICLLDPKAEKVISPEDAQEFDAFLFGGILGDDPPRDRTKELRKLGFPGRHLGPVQMTTDTAVYVTSLVVDQKNKLDELPYVDFPTIHFNKQESVEMPFRYIEIAKTGEPTLPQGMKALLHADTNKSFDDL